MINLQFAKPFTLEKYQQFLKVKKLPEFKLSYDWKKDAYNINVHARFARHGAAPGFIAGNVKKDISRQKLFVRIVGENE